MRPDRFVSCARSAGDLAGVFEHDGETEYFYLYALEARDAEPIRGAIHVCSAPADFAESEVAVRWHPNGQLASRGEYLDGERIRDWEFYAEDGSRIESLSGRYERGLRVSATPESARSAASKH